MGALLGWLLLLAAVGRVAALSCLPCDPSSCPPPPSCPADVVKDVCGCCDACAKVAGETCGGPWSISGTCSSGLTCDKDPNDFNADGVCVVQKCPPGSHWSECGSACPPKCGDEPLFCTLQCVARCVCDDRTHVWHNVVCIPRDSCPGHFCEYNGERYEVGESWGVRETVGKNCLCDGRGERCLFVDCSRGAEHYLTEEGVWDCRPVPTLCPPGVDVVNCFADPCQVTKCPAYPAATCRSNYCGGCNAVFFDANGNKVNCNAYGGCPRGYTKPWAASRRRSLCYRFERKPASYSQAEFRCRADGGRLVTIRSFLVQFRVSILTFLKIHSGVWIGLSDRGRAGRLVWSDGVKYDRWQYSHWCPRTRNIPGDNCVYLSRGLYRWQRGRCTSRRAYVCEYAP